MNEMVSKLITGFLAVMLALSSAAAQKSDQGEVQLKAAIQKQVVDGNLLAAIEMYQKIVATYGNNHAVAAQALLRMGQCYEKLGAKEVGEARKAYERAVREFSDQKDVAIIAQARLVALGSPNSGMSYRQVWAGPNVETSGSISPDGRYLSYTDWNNGSLVLHDFSSGSDRLLIKGTAYELAYRSVISRDGKQVAYSWYSGDHWQLRVAALPTSGFLQPRRLLENAEVDYLVSFDWAPDSKWIAVVFWQKGPNAQCQLGLVSTQDGSLRVLKYFNGFGPTKVSFSPDGKYLATEISITKGSADCDVSILALDGGSETKAVVNPGPDFLMGWSPDGKRLLFASSRTGSMGLWAVPISGGKPTGLPEMLRAEISSPSILGVSSTGALYVEANLNTKIIGMATLDLEAGRLVASAASPIQTLISAGSQPDWSPDGKQLAYFAARRPADEDRVLVVRSMETGQTRELRPKLRNRYHPRWSPDGRSFIMPGWDDQGRRGIYRIDAATGEASPVTVSPDGTFMFPQWSPDGKKIYFTIHPLKSSRPQPSLIEHDLVSGTERELIGRPWLGAPAVLPDGRNVAILSTDQDKSAVLLIPVAGGEPRELIRANAPESFTNSLMCTRDGKNIIVLKNMPGRTELLLVPVGGGPPRKLDNSIPNFQATYLCMHPDGKQIAYLGGEFKSEVWVLENFLPSK